MPRRAPRNRRPSTLAFIREQSGDHAIVVDQLPGQKPTLRVLKDPRDVVAVLDTLPPSALTSPRRQRTADFSDFSSSSHSSASAASSNAPRRCLWIDIQTSDPACISAVLDKFETLHPELQDEVLSGEDSDTLKTFAADGYFFFNTAGASEKVHVSVLAFEDWVVTIHSQPLACVVEAINIIDLHFPLTRHHTASPPPQDLAVDDPGMAPLTAGWIVATLLDVLVDATLPDPTATLSEIDLIDEMVLLILQDHRDLLRRIARARRRLSAERSALYSRQHLLGQLLSPALHGSSIARGSAAEKYRQTLAQLQHVSDRLDAARDALTQANATFVGHIALETSRVSNTMSQKMNILSLIATVCLPLNILTGLFGMNVTVPYQTGDSHSSLVPFFLLVFAVVVWLVVWGGLLVRNRTVGTDSNDEVDFSDHLE